MNAAPPLPETCGPRDCRTGKPENNAGLIGFILAFAGILSCGAMSPFGLLASSIGMLKRPRGLAIAGLVINLLGTIFLTVGLCLFVIVGHASQSLEHSFHDSRTKLVVAAASAIILSTQAENLGKLPSTPDGQLLIAGHKDAWDRELRYLLVDDATYEVSSAGPDGKFGNTDDITQNDLKSPHGRVEDLIDLD